MPPSQPVQVQLEDPQMPSQKIQKHRLELSFPLVSSLSGTSGRAMLAGGSIAGRVLGEPQP